MKLLVTMKLPLILTFILLGSYSRAAILKFEKNQGEVNFSAVGNPGFLKVNGKGAGAQGSLAIENSAAKGELHFELETLETGINLRNKHMKEKYLEVSKYPTATLKITELKLVDFDSKQVEITNQPFKGTLKLHNVENEVSGTFNAKKTANEISGTAEFEIPLSKYQIDLPNYAGVTVAENVKIKVTFSPTQDLTAKSAQ